jgi:hypothetical protein
MCYWTSPQRLTGLMRHRERTSTSRSVGGACFSYAVSDQGAVRSDRHRMGGYKLAMMMGKAYMILVPRRQGGIVCKFHTYPTLGSCLWGTGDYPQPRRYNQNIMQGLCNLQVCRMLFLLSTLFILKSTFVFVRSRHDMQWPYCRPLSRRGSHGGVGAARVSTWWGGTGPKCQLPGIEWLQAYYCTLILGGVRTMACGAS